MASPDPLIAQLARQQKAAQDQQEERRRQAEERAGQRAALWELWRTAWSVIFLMPGNEQAWRSVGGVMRQREVLSLSSGVQGAELARLEGRSALNELKIAIRLVRAAYEDKPDQVARDIDALHGAGLMGRVLPWLGILVAWLFTNPADPAHDLADAVNRATTSLDFDDYQKGMEAFQSPPMGGSAATDGPGGDMAASSSKPRPRTGAPKQYPEAVAYYWELRRTAPRAKVARIYRQVKERFPDIPAIRSFTRTASRRRL